MSSFALFIIDFISKHVSFLNSYLSFYDEYIIYRLILAIYLVEWVSFNKIMGIQPILNALSR